MPKDSKSKSAKSSAKDVFSYLLMIIMLYIGVISFIAMLWQYTNYQFPDPLEYYVTGVFEIIRTSISSLIVAWPVFIGMSWLINKDIKKNKEKKSLWVRKWLLYLTLFIAALTIIIDTITLVNSFLGGELTTRFALKVLIILAVAIAVFWYYLWELRRDPAKKTSVPKNSAIATSVIIVAFIIIGFFIVGTPAQQREIRMDEQRVSDLQEIQWQIVEYYQSKEALPSELSVLPDSIRGFEVPVDPITGAAYTYTVKGDLNFELCATFSAETPDFGASKIPSPRAVGGLSENWNHDAGTVCFDRDIDPDLYPQFKEVR